MWMPGTNGGLCKSNVHPSLLSRLSSPSTLFLDTESLTKWEVQQLDENSWPACPSDPTVSASLKLEL